MKFPAKCYSCALDELPDEYIELEFHENGVYEFTCRNNHSSTLHLLHPHFEILFELGAMALIDGYPREAVSSFASSVERFYEYCINKYLLPQEIDSTVFNESWKLVSSNSERQLGAYYFLYLFNIGETPEPILRKWVEFRNDVIHKGKIPKYEEVYDYAQYIYSYLKRVHHILRANLKVRSSQDGVIKISTEGTVSKLRSFQVYSTVLGITINMNSSDDSFPHALESLKGRMKDVFRK